MRGASASWSGPGGITAIHLRDSLANDGKNLSGNVQLIDAAKYGEPMLLAILAGPGAGKGEWALHNHAKQIANAVPDSLQSFDYILRQTRTACRVEYTGFQALSGYLFAEAGTPVTFSIDFTILMKRGIAR